MRINKFTRYRYEMQEIDCYPINRYSHFMYRIYYMEIKS